MKPVFIIIIMYSRRQFLESTKKGLTTALIASPVTSLLTSACSALEKEGDKLGIALIGLGHYSEYQLAPALQQTQKCYLAGIVTGTPEKAVKWKDKYNIPDNNIYNYQNFDSIADNKAIDMVYVVLPNSMHHEFVIRAAKAGKHVICEKPMAMSVKESEEMIDACKKAGVKLSIGYRLHFEPYNLEAARIGQKKELGKVKLIEASFGFRSGDPNQWRLKKALAGGGALMDIGIYALQATRYCTGEEPISVLAQEFKTDPVKFKEVDETICWQLEFPGGTVANCSTTYASHVERLYLSAEDGWLEMSPSFGYGPLKGKTSKGEMNFPHVRPQVAQMDDFAACVLGNRESTVSGEEGLKDMKVIEAIYASIQTGKKIKIG